MSGRFILSSPASRDLNNILTYVLETSGEQRARRVAARFKDAFAKLVDNPGLGHRREDLTSSPLLFFTVWSYFIIYRATDESLEVARVVHGARDVETLLRDGPL